MPGHICETCPSAARPLASRTISRLPAAAERTGPLIKFLVKFLVKFCHVSRDSSAASAITGHTCIVTVSAGPQQRRSSRAQRSAPLDPLYVPAAHGVHAEELEVPAEKEEGACRVRRVTSRESRRFKRSNRPGTSGGPGWARNPEARSESPVRTPRGNPGSRARARPSTGKGLWSFDHWSAGQMPPGAPAPHRQRSGIRSQPGPGSHAASGLRPGPRTRMDSDGLGWTRNHQIQFQWIKRLSTTILRNGMIT